MQDCHLKQLLKNINPMMLALFCSLTKRYLQRPCWKTCRMTDYMQIYQPRRKMCNKTSVHTIDVQSLRASVGEWQLVDITPVWHCQSQNQGYWGALVVMWCCHNSSCWPYVRSKASSSFFSAGEFLGTQGAWGSQLFPITLPTVQWFWKIFENRLTGKFIVKYR